MGRGPQLRFLARRRPDHPSSACQRLRQNRKHRQNRPRSWVRRRHLTNGSKPSPSLAPSSLASKDAESAIRTIGERALNERRRERILQRQAAVETTASSGSWRRVLIGGILASIVVGIGLWLFVKTGLSSKKVAGELQVAHSYSRRPALRHR